MVYLRCPDMFSVETHEDFYAYGVVQVVENLLLDFVEADGDWRAQWAVVEGMAWFLLDGIINWEMEVIVDKEGIDALIRLVMHVFLAMLALLESRGLLGPQSEILDLEFIMAMYMHAAALLRSDIGVLQDGDERKWHPDAHSAHVKDYIMAYAKKSSTSNSILPCIDPANPHGSSLDFFQGSPFADFRTEEDVTRARDPMYSDDDSPKMRPWMTPLCMMVNHQSVLIYDAERHVVGIYDQCSPGSYDRNIHEGVIFGTTDGDWTKRYFRVLEDETGEEGTVEEWERSRRGEGGDSDKDGRGDDREGGGDGEIVTVDGEVDGDEGDINDEAEDNDDEDDFERAPREVGYLRSEIEEYEKEEIKAKEERQKRLAAAKDADEEWAFQMERAST
ncbi:hypothetical protein B0T16DRAFT_463567 [Cercophora newfieldiana]|uniref:Uncharacterized protein n=1 Tax=Cercophora newfieldiana TaxID=92897 RepID=A0AA39XTI1_9PEZI|nr:hypothetical protein B0T16DRAFT_463567 [Cercophora newfieldiana]